MTDKETIQATKELFDAIRKLLLQNDCKTVRDLPESVRRSALDMAAQRGLLTKDHVKEIEAYWAGGPEPEAKFLAALPDSFFGPTQ